MTPKSGGSRLDERGTHILRLEGVYTQGRILSVDYSVDHWRHRTTFAYTSVDFGDFAQRFGVHALRRVTFHIALFEIIKAVSYRPAKLDLGEFTEFFTAELKALWDGIVRGVWAQWRYENGDPDYLGPALVRAGDPDHGPSPVARIPVQHQAPRPLLLCGGGKDSLLAMKLLDVTGASYDTASYSSTVYGDLDLQDRLIANVISSGDQIADHRITIDEDFESSPVPEELRSRGITTKTAAETPLSVFACIPIAMMHDLDSVVVGHESSASSQNLIWDLTGEPINHQWGKSRDAESLLAEYVGQHLVSDLSYFSVLSPLRDAMILFALRSWPRQVAETNSCNVRTPWCLKCPKCAYVWLSMKAYLPWHIADEMFGGANLLDDEDLAVAFRQLLGLEAHTPFECVGSVEDTRLAFAVCHARGLGGNAMKLFELGYPELDPLDLIGPASTPDFEGWLAPEWARAPLTNWIVELTVRARDDLFAGLTPPVKRGRRRRHGTQLSAAS